MASAARRQIIGGGGGAPNINNCQRRRLQSVDGAERPAQGSCSDDSFHSLRDQQYVGC